jgi:DNA-binding NarL/FixJ family response regulator
MTEPLRIIVVDDHRLFRDGLRQLLGADDRFEVVGEAASGEEFLALDSTADVVFMDIDMPGMGGVEATRRALERCPDTRVIALSMHGEREFYGPMLEAGARGFLLKDSPFAEVVTAARSVAAGGTHFSPELPDALTAAPQDSDRASEGHFTEPLSERETEVLPLVCEGLSNNEIADRLFISKRTVDKHRANILAKTGCRNTASLVVYAVKNNLIKI